MWIIGVVLLVFWFIVDEHFIAAAAFLFFMFGTPTTLASALSERHHGWRPFYDLKLGQLHTAETERPRDDRDWLRLPFTPDSWNPEDPCAPFDDGVPIPDHPENVGTPRHPRFTLYTMFALMAIPFLFLSS